VPINDISDRGPRGTSLRLRTGRTPAWIAGLAGWVCLAASCSAPAPRAEPDPAPGPSATATSEQAEASTSAGEETMPPPSGPDPVGVIAAAKTPHEWVRGHGRTLLRYVQSPTRWWPEDFGKTAVALVTPRGRVVRRWSPPVRWEALQWWPAGRGFVGVNHYGALTPGPMLLTDGGVTELTPVRGARHHRAGDVRFGKGWLLDRTRTTVTRELLPPTRCAGSALVDLRGRVWCLDRRKRTLSWTDDGRSWDRHRLSTTYFEYCDGGTLGAEIEVLGDRVAVGLWRADVSGDRGRTWHDVDLPYRLVGAHRVSYSSEANCTRVSPLSDGRLLLSYFGDAVATSPSNTEFTLLDFPVRRFDYSSVSEGVLVAPQRRYGERLVSYDGGTTWDELRVRSLLAHLFARRH